MQKYELTVVLDAKSTPAKKKALGETVEKIVKVFEGKMEKTDDWGERGAGQVLHFLLELDRAHARDLAIKLNGEEGIKKHLIIKQNGRNEEIKK